MSLPMSDGVFFTRDAVDFLMQDPRAIKVREYLGV
jgi:hypothetical protein